MHWQTTGVTRRLESAVRTTRAAHAPWVSAGVVTLPERLLGFTKGLLVRDPDGHAIQSLEP